MHEPLRNYCSLKGGTGFPEVLQGKKEGDLAFIKVSDMSLSGNERFITVANNYVDEGTATRLGANVFPARSIVFAKVGAALLLNRRRMLTSPTIIDNNMMAAIPTEADPEFLFHFLCSVDFANYVQMGALPSINQSALGAIPFPKLSMPQQRRIAEILSTLDEAIAQTEALIAKHQQIKAGLMHDLFTRGVTPDGHLRPTREQASDLYKESPLGWIPKEWRIKRIRELGVVKGGKRVPAGTPFADAPTPFPYLRVTDMVDGWIDDTALEYVDSTTERLISSYKIFRDDIYVTIAGTLGQFGRIPEHLNGAQLTENAARITEIDKKIVDLDYLCFVLISDLLEEQKFAGIGVGAGVPKLALYQIGRFQVPIPSLEEQRQIQLLLNCSQSNILENRDVLRKLRQQKHGLMYDLLTGRVRAPQKEAEVTL